MAVRIRWAESLWWTMWKMSRLRACCIRNRCPKAINTMNWCWIWHDKMSMNFSVMPGTMSTGWPRSSSRWSFSDASSLITTICECECTAPKCESHAVRWFIEKWVMSRYRSTIHHYQLGGVSYRRISRIFHFFVCFRFNLRQGLRLSALSASKTGSGYLVNLLSNDVGRLDMGFIFAHYIWILPFQVSECGANERHKQELDKSMSMLFFVSVGFDMLFDLATHWMGGPGRCGRSVVENGAGADATQSYIVGAADASGPSDRWSRGHHEWNHSRHSSDQNVRMGTTVPESGGRGKATWSAADSLCIVHSRHQCQHNGIHREVNETHFISSLIDYKMHGCVFKTVVCGPNMTKKDPNGDYSADNFKKKKFSKTRDMRSEQNKITAHRDSR